VNINDPEIRRAFLDADIISFVNDNKSADDGEEGVAAV
jgi:hypothetical protein